MNKFAFISIVLVMLVAIFAIRSLPKVEETSNSALDSKNSVTLTMATPTTTAVTASPSGTLSTTPTQTTPTSIVGLGIKDDLIGTGKMVKSGDTIKVNYVGKLTNGTEFDSSKKPGRAPFSFVIGQGSVIEGWEKGILGMQVGGKRTLTIAPNLGYGDKPAGTIPPNSTLIFEVELLGIE